MHTSKAFHATLPWLDDAELSRLRAWACQNCAASRFAREEDVVMAFLRSVRSTLKRLASASRAAERLRRVSAEGSLASPRKRR